MPLAKDRCGAASRQRPGYLASLRNTTPAVKVEPIKFGKAKHKARDRADDVLLDRHINDDVDVVPSLGFRSCGPAELVVIDKARHKLCFLSGRATKKKVHVSKLPEIVATRIQ